ncbi:MAG: FMN-binding glutamate synthase family protein [Planctomycetes bacterium]|nr:FMN-binding glutamate synthase family protein [Planctomycetota bacterium]
MWTWIVAHPWTSFLAAFLVFVVVIAIRDIFFMRRHAIRHNFPVVGNLRYFLEMVGPELRQYWVANDREELPFSRSERAWIYSSAKAQNTNFGFGTAEQIYSIGYPIIKPAAFPFPESKATYPGDDKTEVPCLKVIGEGRRRRPFRPRSIVNISAMSFGSLGERAVRSLNRGARDAGAYHNTGEGGLSPYHRQGAEVVWQLGTGYFGARGPQGFDLDRVAEVCAAEPNVRMIEVKLSQGAKPGKGGILPGAKVTPEIAAIRGVPVGQDCISPNAHTEFDDVDGLIDFVERIAERTGLPVGIKSAVGKLDFWEDLARRMKATGRGPDYIVIDGGEGGTGAAPLTFADHVSLPFKIAFQRVYQVFQKEDMASRVVWIGAGKLGFPDRAMVALAMGCDLIYVAREAMIAIGCIQAQKCHTDHCPAGVATQNRWLQAGIDVDDKALRMSRYLKSFRKELLNLAHACGYEHPAQIKGSDIECSTGVNRFSTLDEILGYVKEEVPFGQMKDLQPTP